MTLSPRPADKAPLTRSFRRGVAVALFAVLAAVLAFFFTRGKKPAGPELLPEKPVTAQKVDEREQVHYIEFRGGREKIDFQADRGYVGPDGQYHMVGHVQIADYGREGGRQILAHCDEIIHNADRTRFRLSGHVQIHMQDATFETKALDYDRAKNVFSTDGDISISSRTMEGTARGMTYSLATEEIWFRSEVRLETRVSERSAVPLVFRSPKLYYSRPICRGRFEGGVTFTHGGSRGSAETVEFQLFRDRNMLDILHFKGGVAVHLEGEFEAEGGSRKPKADTLLGLGDRQDIRADEIKLRAFQNSSLLHSYESSGNASIAFVSATKGTTRFQARTLDFIFNQDGGLREFRGEDNVRMVKTVPDGTSETAAGDWLRLPGNSDVLQIGSRKRERVTARFRSSEITASALGMDLKTDDFQGADIKAVFLPAEGQKAVGLFSAEKPIFVTSRWMKYAAEAKSYRFFGGMKMWQEKSELFALDTQLTEDTGECLAKGTVRSVFPHQPKEGRKEELMEIAAGVMHYDPDKSTAYYEEEAGLKTGEFRLASTRLRVLLNRDTQQPERMLAQDKVVLTQTDREGRSGEAVYLVDQRLVVMTGHPVATEKDKGEIRGDKLTFHLADDTITVENDERDRSVTKIKS
jgi:LPS export ABC transporter protein LptC/lipopolysaccharide transport protein LptA